MTKILLFSDLHGSHTALRKLEAFLAEHAEIEGLVFTGDFVNSGSPVSFTGDFIDFIKKSGRPFLWVSGNNDWGDAYEWLAEEYPPVEGVQQKMGDMVFSGVGGSPEIFEIPSLSYKYNPAPELLAGTIFLSHTPPPGKIDYKPELGSVPSPLLSTEKQKNRKAEEQKHSTLEIINLALPVSERKLVHSPLAHICGHIHHTYGAAFIGNTKVIKLGAVMWGHCGILNLSTLIVEFAKLP